MGLKQQAGQIRQGGMERAAAIWETFETLAQPLEPLDIYKASCTIKCAEFFARVRNNPVADMLAAYLGKFLDETIKIVGEESGSLEEGKRALDVFEKEMPLTEEIFNDAVAYAERQHIYDGIILLSAAKMGKEMEVKECIERLQTGVAKAMLINMLAMNLSEDAPIQ